MYKSIKTRIYGSGSDEENAMADEQNAMASRIMSIWGLVEVDTAST